MPASPEAASPKQLEFSLVLATERHGGIGMRGELPWPRLKGDMRFYRELTSSPDRQAVETKYLLVAGMRADEAFPTGRLEEPVPMPGPEASRNAVLMGRATWDSLPARYRPLAGRLNVVLSRTQNASFEGAMATGSLQEALRVAEAAGCPHICVVGGGLVFSEALKHPGCTRIYLTRIEAEFPSDVFFPPLPPDFKEKAASPKVHEGKIAYSFRLYQREG